MKTQEGHGLVFPLRKQKARLQSRHPHKPVFFSIRHFAGFFKSHVWPGKKKDISVWLVVPIGSTCRYPPDPKGQHAAHRAPAPGPAARRRRGRGWRAATETVGAADLWLSLGLGDRRSPPSRAGSTHLPPARLCPGVLGVGGTAPTACSAGQSFQPARAGAQDKNRASKRPCSIRVMNHLMWNESMSPLLTK